MPEKKKSNQLHQLLAVETDLKNKAKVIMSETMTTFVKKQDHFDGIIKDYKQTLEGTMDIPPEIKEIVTTVSDKIDYTKKRITDSIDATISKEETNNSGEAVAEIEVGSNTIKLSATSLLALSSYLERVRELYQTIPTLDPTKKWNSDPKSGKGVYQTEPEIKFRTEKKEEHIVVVPATDKFPAQIAKAVKDVQVGKYETVYKSGKITPRQKADLLERIEKLIITVKKARARANTAEVKNIKIGEKIFDYINKDILK